MSTVRLALVRRLIQIDAPIPPEDQDMLTRDDPFYTVAVAGLPEAFAVLEPLLDTVKAQTMMMRGNKAPIAPTTVQLFINEADQSVLVEYKSPKTDAVTIDDTDVECVTTPKTTTRSRRPSSWTNMVFADQLALQFIDGVLPQSPLCAPCCLQNTHSCAQARAVKTASSTEGAAPRTSRPQCPPRSASHATATAA